jgi:cellobiose dehydrogenase (acceptor)
MQQGYNVIAGGLKASGWQELTLNDNPSWKNHTYGHTPYMFSHGERGGPMATYLVSASKRSNFKLWMNTTVKRVVRTAAGHVTGVEVEPFLDGGYEGVVNVTAKTGRVVLSAGTFGSARILMRSTALDFYFVLDPANPDRRHRTIGSVEYREELD